MPMKNDKKLSLHLRGENLKLVREQAEKEKRTVNQVINLSIEKYIAEWKA